MPTALKESRPKWTRIERKSSDPSLVIEIY